MRRILCSDWLPEQVTTDNLKCTMGFLLTTLFCSILCLIIFWWWVGRERGLSNFKVAVNLINLNIYKSVKTL